MTITYAELASRSNQLARFLHACGLRRGDHVAFCLENSDSFFCVAWAAQRSGLYYTPLSTRLTAEEAAYIINDCGASVFMTSIHHREIAASVVAGAPRVTTRLIIGGELEGYKSYESSTAGYSGDALDEGFEGADMLYSSGTTGRPKGIRRPLPNCARGAGLSNRAQLFQIDRSTVYLSPAPLYHAAPLRFTMEVQRAGGTVIVMERFDPVEFLRLVERYRVTHTQVVPTMFVRLLKLSPSERLQFDLSSLRVAIHAAAPCPIPVKEEMIAWWGPIIVEYYSATEGNGFCHITSKEWLSHKGSVGRSVLGTIHITDDHGVEVPVGAPGLVYFEGGGEFEYHNDPIQTVSSRHPSGWTTVGDIGRVDSQGYLYLTDRQANVIITGGINVYPQEAENVLMTHPSVLDVAVIGIPNEDLGEEVKAVVQLVDPDLRSDSLAKQLILLCRQHLAPVKCPRSIDFRENLPREPNGKLYKRLLRQQYWEGRESKLI